MTRDLASNTFVALLRGINVGGNSLIKMADLKACFEKAGFQNVRTYIASGNVIFQAAEKNRHAVEEKVGKIVGKEFKAQPKVLIRSFDEMKKLIKGIPKNWNGNANRRYNIIFLKKSIDSKKILMGLNPKPEIEEVLYLPGALLWSASTSDLSRTSMVKLSSRDIYKYVTVRNLNTTKKVFEIMQELESK